MDKSSKQPAERAEPQPKSTGATEKPHEDAPDYTVDGHEAGSHASGKAESSKGSIQPPASNVSQTDSTLSQPLTIHHSLNM